MLSVDEYREIYAVLEQAQPVSFDCGSLCDSICCNSSSFDDEEAYIYLLPGENEYLTSVGCKMRITRQKRSGHALPVSWGEYVYIACCPGKENCDRNTRPIQCRTFPLAPCISDKGELEMTLCYMDLPYSCPFVDEKVVVSGDFWHKTLKAWQMLVKDKAIMDLVKYDSKHR